MPGVNVRNFRARRWLPGVRNTLQDRASPTTALKTDSDACSSPKRCLTNPHYAGGRVLQSMEIESLRLPVNTDHPKAGDAIAMCSVRRS